MATATQARSSTQVQIQGPTLLRGRSNSKTCTAAGLGLGKVGFPGLGPKLVYVVMTNAELVKVCECDSIDFAYVWDCPDCTTDTLDTCKLRTITGTDANGQVSLGVYNSPKITSLAGLTRLTGDLRGGLYVGRMHALTSLNGLHKISSMETLYLLNNPELGSATALGQATVRGELQVDSCPKLLNIPASWRYLVPKPV